MQLQQLLFIYLKIDFSLIAFRINRVYSPESSVFSRTKAKSKDESKKNMNAEQFMLGFFFSLCERSLVSDVPWFLQSFHCFVLCFFLCFFFWPMTIEYSKTNIWPNDLFYLEWWCGKQIGCNCIWFTDEFHKTLCLNLRFGTQFMDLWNGICAPRRSKNVQLQEQQKKLYEMNCIEQIQNRNQHTELKHSGMYAK